MYSIRSDYVYCVDDVETLKTEEELMMKLKTQVSLDPGLGFLFLKYCNFCIDILKKVPKDVDLLNIFNGCELHYGVIGKSLEVNVADIKYDANAAKDSLRLVFERWRQRNIDVTWKRIIQVCQDFPDEFGRVKSDLKKYLSSEKAREKYLDKK